MNLQNSLMFGSSVKLHKINSFTKFCWFSLVVINNLFHSFLIEFVWWGLFSTAVNMLVQPEVNPTGATLILKSWVYYPNWQKKGQKTRQGLNHENLLKKSDKVPNCKSLSRVQNLKKNVFFSPINHQYFLWLCIYSHGHSPTYCLFVCLHGKEE